MKKHKVLKIVLIFFAAIILIAIAAISIYCYKCTHYWQADMKKVYKAGFNEKQMTLPDGAVMNYAEGPDNGINLLLIHGQSVTWEDYARVLPELSKNFHVYAVDCYGHGKSSHDENKYYMKENGDDIIRFIDSVVGEKTIVSGHSSGGLLASYVAAYGGENIAGAVLEDPPVFSTERDYFESSFAYQDSFKNIHEFITADTAECWEAYYMRNCYWGQLYMPPEARESLAAGAQAIHDKAPDKPVQFPYMPESINVSFLYSKEYDMIFGEHFYDYSWHSGIAHEQLMSDIKIPTVFIHAKDMFSDDGILMAASSDEQARKAVSLIENCEFIELESNHDIHRFNPDTFIDAVNKCEEML